MAIVLPYETQVLPQFRLHFADTCTGATTPLPMATVGRNGYDVRSFSRTALPDFGSLIFTYKFGIIDGRNYEFVGDSFSGEGYADLVGTNIVLESSKDEGATWQVVFIGECLAQDEQSWPGSSTRAGMVTYHCRDLLHRLTKWQLLRHVPYVGTLGEVSQVALSYNAESKDGNRLLGNKESTSATPTDFTYFYAHVQDGSQDAAAWTDLDVIQHAIDSADQPLVGGVNDLVWASGIVTGATTLLSSANFWKIEDGQTVFSLLQRILDRRRGVGLAALSFDSTLAANGSINSLNPSIKVFSQFIDDITFTPPGGSLVTIDGATTNGTVSDVDLIGDHRLVDEAFQIAAETETQYDAVITSGDFIEVIVTVSTDNYLSERWTSTEATAYDALVASGDDPSEDDTKWGNVYSTIGFSYSWTFQAPDWSGTTTTGQSFMDVSCNQDLTLGFNDGKRGSPLAFSITDDLPLAAGWDYTANPAVKISGDQSGKPDLTPMQLFKRVNASPERYVDAVVDFQANVSRAGYNGNDFKIISTAGPYFAAASDQDDHWLTVNVRLNNRLETYSGDLTGSVKRVKAQGLGLQLMHNGAIIGLDYDSPSNDGFPPLHGGTATISVDAKNFYVVRDDRAQLLRTHKIAEQWYTTLRRTAKWGLRAYGFGSFAQLDESTVDYPQLGYIIGAIEYGGFNRAVNTPVTRIEYDHDSGVTQWVTSWSDRDWRI